MDCPRTQRFWDRCHEMGLQRSPAKKPGEIFTKLIGSLDDREVVHCLQHLSLGTGREKARIAYWPTTAELSVMVRELRDVQRARNAAKPPALPRPEKNNVFLQEMMEKGRAALREKPLSSEPLTVDPRTLSDYEILMLPQLSKFALCIVDDTNEEARRLNEDVRRFARRRAEVMYEG